MLYNQIKKYLKPVSVPFFNIFNISIELPCNNKLARTET